MANKPATRSGGRPNLARKNAQIREEVKPQTDTAVQAEQSKRLLNDPAFKQGMAALESECIRQIVGLMQDGSPETAELERILCVNLRVIKSFPRAIAKVEQRQTLREHDFRPRVIEPEKEEE